MVKLKKRNIPFSNTAEEIRTGVFRFKVGGVQWEYDELGVGFNLGVVDPETNKPQYQIRLKTLNEAACFVEGYHAGQQVN